MVATAGPQVYCHKRQTVLQLVEAIKLVLGYTATDRILITGMSIANLPKSTQQIGQTKLWRSATVRVTPFSSTEVSNSGDRTTGDNRLRHLRFQDETVEIKVP